VGGYEDSDNEVGLIIIYSVFHPVQQVFKVIRWSSDGEGIAGRIYGGVDI
jgi:hypothetical protein